MNDHGERRYMTKEQAAEYLSVSPKTIDRWVREGRLKRYKVAGTRSVRFLKGELDALVEPEEPAA